MLMLHNMLFVCLCLRTHTCTFLGKEPAVVARGGFSGLFPESSATANDLAISSSSPDLTMLCNLQLTKDGAGFCLSDIRLDNSTTISTFLPKGQKTYKVYGQNLKGWFALDYSADTIFSNVSRMSLSLSLFFSLQLLPHHHHAFTCSVLLSSCSKHLLSAQHFRRPDVNCSRGGRPRRQASQVLVERSGFYSASL